MKNNPIVIVENGKLVGDLLLDSLLESNILTESKHKLLTSHMMLTESASTKFVTYKGHRINRNVFHAVYTNLSDYSTVEQILIGLGFKPEEVGEIKKNSRGRALARIIDDFNKYADPDDGHVLYPKLRDRVSFYTQDSRQEAGWDEPTIDDIDGGRRGISNTTTRVTQKINSQDLLSGEFYADRTRIPKTRWTGWLRFWNRRKTSVRPDGGRWKKTFILGYQVERNVLYEVWYNSIDSTFTLHDRGGVEMSGRMKSMVESIRVMIKTISQESDTDGDFFSGNTPDARQLSNSVTRALTQTTDSRAEQLARADEKEFKRERALRIRRAKDIADAEKTAKERLNKARDFIRDGTISAVKSTQRGLSSEGKRVLDKIRMSAEDANNILKTAGNMAYDDLVKFAQRELSIQKDGAKIIVDEFSKLFPNDYKFDKNASDRAWDEMEKEQREKSAWKNDNKKDAGYDSRRKSRMKKNEKKMGTHRKDADDDSDLSADERMMKDADKSAKQREDQLKKDIKRSLERNKKDQKLNESTQNQINLFEQEDPVGVLDDLISDKVDNRSYDNEIKKIRQQAERSPYTQQVLGQNVLGQIDTYDETRVRRSFMGNWLDNTITKGSIRNIFGGRQIKLPTDRPSVFQRTKMAFKGQRYRADFVIGWTLSDRVDLEIWYITEPNPTYDATDSNNAPTIASFYVFDVSSGSIVRRFIPHYRNALQVVMGKLSPLL